MDNYEERISKLEKEINDHMHLVEEIIGLSDELNNKANQDHFHDFEHIHSNKHIIDTIDESSIAKWNSKADWNDIPTKVSQLNNDRGFYDKIELEKYLDERLPDFKTFISVEDCNYLLNSKAPLYHTHKMNHIEELDNSLSKKVDKIKGKSLIKDELIKKIELFFKSKESGDGSGDHVHINFDVLDSIDLLDIEKWNNKINMEDLEEYLKTYIPDDSASLAELDRRLGGLTLIPVTTAEFNNLTSEEVKDPSKLYIVTDAVSTGGSTENSGGAYDDSELRQMINGKVSLDELNTRLASMTLMLISESDFELLDSEEKNSMTKLYLVVPNS